MTEPTAPKPRSARSKKAQDPEEILGSEASSEGIENAKPETPDHDDAADGVALPSPPQVLPRTVIVTFLQHGNGAASSIGRQVVDQLTHALRDLDPADRDETTVDVWLDSPGGDAHAAYKIGLLLRSVASKIRVVVPDYAKSAATLLSLVADEIYMAPAAELGPLDAQIGYEQEGMTISALDRARSLDDLTEAALQIVLGGGAMVLQNTRLSRAETITSMLDFAAKFLNPVVAKLDPTILHWSGTLLKVAAEYGRRLMLTREDCPSDLANRVPQRLVEDYPTHGFVISIKEARELGLPVRDLAEYEYRDALRVTQQMAGEDQINLIGILPTLPPSSTIEEPIHGEEHDDNDNQQEDAPDTSDKRQANHG